MHKVVAHLHGGILVKGTVGTFQPNAPRFAVRLRDSNEVEEIEVARMKALFFVADYDGNPERRARGDADRVGLGRKVRVDFLDGEVLFGYTTGYSPGRPTFWVTPADPDSNNERIFVVSASTESVAFVD